MPKRARSDSLTGGSRDVNPQFISFSTTTAGATAESTTIQVPIDKLANPSRPTIIELLKVFWNINVPGETDLAAQMVLSTSSLGATAPTAAILGNTKVIATKIVETFITTSGQVVAANPYETDLTDGAGHGILIGTDQIFMQVKGTAAVTVSAKIMYRYKTVALVEYIGIVQSQQ